MYENQPIVPQPTSVCVKFYRSLHKTLQTFADISDFCSSQILYLSNSTKTLFELGNFPVLLSWLMSSKGFTPRSC